MPEHTIPVKESTEARRSPISRMSGCGATTPVDRGTRLAVDALRSPRRGRRVIRVAPEQGIGIGEQGAVRP